MKNRAKHDKAYYDKRKVARHAFFQSVGTVCFVCDSDNNEHLKCHRKDCQYHEPFEDMSLKRLSEEEPKDYARLCYKCHFGVHWLHDQFGLPWRDVIYL